MLVYVSALISTLLTLLAGVPYLDFLTKNMEGQFIREDGPASHSVKAGTPTMGGLIIVIPAIVGAVLSLIMDQKTTIEALIILITFSLFTLLGLKDDISKLTKKKNKGISAGGKLLIQILISLIPALYVYYNGGSSVSVFGLATINLGIFYPLFAVFLITGFSNAVNLTDGLDGLASGLSVFTLTAVSIICVAMGRSDLAIISAAVAGSCLTFLYYNKYPAKVFMGDTGSLALGGIIAALAVIGKFEFWILIIGLVFVLETLSVMMQVTSYKLTKKRIFKMSPIHHHFELSGWSETKVVYTFWVVGIIFAVIGTVLKLYLI
jgi:phospho-N-acetylmuramoyl-pentapeptide-transferase